MTTLGGTQEYVFVNSIGELADFEAVGAGVLAGKIVMCYRGTTSFFEKANAAASMGAAGVVIVNNQPGIINMDLTGYEYTVPVVSILQADGEVFKKAGTENTTESGITYWTGSMVVSDSLGAGQYNSEYYTMSSFSSWGVPGSLELKPEITAPGGSIYSVAGANVTKGQLLFTDHKSYEIMSGTSMASPQVAGMAALMAQYIRETDLDEKTGLDERTLTQSLLMSTAVPLRDGNSGGNYYPVIQQGAGLANVGAASTADSYIIMGSDATASWEDGKVKAELGDDPAKTGKYTFSFTINNLTDVEKTFALSADVFTQDAFSYSGILLMDTWTTNLTPTVSWTVNGKSVDSGEELEGLDFNGDGTVNSADGQILLEYATGLDVTLSNADKADLDSDGEIDSYDSYLFFTMLNAGGAVVPANGSANVTVTIELSDADKQWLAYYANGAYIEAYVYAESLTTAEGVEGTTHSIPVLGFYGNWSDASMFDKGSYVEFAHGLENRPPYLYGSAYQNGNYNGLLIKYSDMDGEYWFGGNPMVTDDTYMPERDAISAERGDMISKLGFTAIRNAADSYFYIANTETGEFYANQSLGQVSSAFYYTNGGYWRNTYYTLNAGFSPVGIPEDTTIEVGLTLIPEYYVENGNVNWDALGNGVTLSMPMVVDNTAPTVDDVDVDVNGNVLTVTATDNQYIAAIALYDIYGQHLYTYCGSNAEQAAGDTVEFALDLAEVNGPSFLLQVYDYAMNTATYEIATQIGEVTDKLESIKLDKTALVMQKGDTDSLTAIVYPVNASSRGVVWSSSDESVVTVDENGTLTAVAVGTATITAAADADETLTATCAVEVIDISAEMNAIVWDEEGSIWFSEFAANDLPNYTKLSPDMLEEDYFVSAAVADDGTLYASSLNTSNGTGSIYTVDPETYEVTFLTDCVVQGLHIFYSDLTYAPAMFGTGVLLGTYGPYVISIDPTTGEAIEIIDQYDSDLVGITTCFGMLDEADDGTLVYQDVVYVIQNDGTVIQEIYYGYGGVVVPYMNYFYGERASFDAGVDVGDAWYFNSAYYDGSYLYWSAFDQNTENAVTLYAIDADYTGNVYTMGQFGEGVWPVGGLHKLNAVVAEESSDVVDVNAKIGSVSEIQLVAKSFPVKEEVAGGSLNSTAVVSSDAISPMSDAAVEDGPKVVTVTITAKDATGASVDSTNGVSTVTYDTEVLTLASVKVEGDYTAVKEEDGSVTFGYVDLEGIPADATVATLTFIVNHEADTTVTVTTEEVSDEDSDYVEDLQIDLVCDHNWELLAFKWTEDYSACAVTYLCDVCEETETYDCEVTSVTTDATCETDGKIVYTATYGDDSDVKEVTIPATGHNYEDGSCTECGEEDPDYEAPTDPSEPCDPPKPGWGSIWDWIFGGWWGDGEEEEKCEHSYTSVVTDPTCDEKGYTTHTCSKCGDSYKDSYTNAMGHKYVDGICEHCGDKKNTKPGGFWGWFFGWWN